MQTVFTALTFLLITSAIFLIIILVDGDSFSLWLWSQFVGFCLSACFLKAWPYWKLLQRPTSSSTIHEHFGVILYIFQHDGARCLRVKVVTKCLRDHQINLLDPQPGNSSDLSLIMKPIVSPLISGWISRIPGSSMPHRTAEAMKHEAQHTVNTDDWHKFDLFINKCMIQIHNYPSL